MRAYSNSVVQFLTGFLAPYQQHWKLDYASFRPQEEQGRDLPLRRRNDLLHTDAFPTRPTHGARILRFFNNIHPARTRDWIVSDPFAATVRQFAPREIAPRPGSALSRAAQAHGPRHRAWPGHPFIQAIALRRLHDALPQFPEGKSALPGRLPQIFLPVPRPVLRWMVYTDTVPHAVLAGQYALEQTFLVRPEAMVRPEISPLRILEDIAHAPLV